MVTIAAGALPYERDSTERANGARLAAMGNSKPSLAERFAILWQTKTGPIAFIISVFGVSASVAGAIMGVRNIAMIMQIAIVAVPLLCAIITVWAFFRASSEAHAQASDEAVKASEAAARIEARNKTLESKLDAFITQATKNQSDWNAAAHAGFSDALAKVVARNHAVGRLASLLDTKIRWTKMLQDSENGYQSLLTMSKEAKRHPDEHVHDKNMQRLRMTIMSWEGGLLGPLQDFRHVFQQDHDTVLEPIPDHMVQARIGPNEENLGPAGPIMELRKAVLQRARFTNAMEDGLRRLDRLIVEAREKMGP